MVTGLAGYPAAVPQRHTLKATPARPALGPFLLGPLAELKQAINGWPLFHAC
jgi:hypothetical protein